MSSLDAIPAPAWLILPSLILGSAAVVSAWLVRDRARPPEQIIAPPEEDDEEDGCDQDEDLAPILAELSAEGERKLRDSIREVLRAELPSTADVEERLAAVTAPVAEAIRASRQGVHLVRFGAEAEAQIRALVAAALRDERSAIIAAIVAVRRDYSGPPV